MSKPAGFSQSGFSYGWIVVGAGALMTCVGFGTMLSLAVFLQPIATDTGWSVSGVSAAATIDFLAMGFAAFFWGALSDRFGTRIVVLWPAPCCSASAWSARARPRASGNSSFSSAC